MRSVWLVIILACLTPVFAGAQTAAAEAANQALVRSFVEATNRGDAKAAAAMYSGDAKNFGRAVGRKGIEDRLVDIFTTFPDWHMEVVQMVASGDAVVALCRVTGTHRGVGRMPLNGMPVGAAPTGKHFEVMHTHWFTVRNEQIVEHFANRDDLGMLRQLGLLPPATP
jgi:steroid delta-isomerase-like uncharacterized protein